MAEILSKKPRHIAFIMDGNGRWAQQRGLPRTAGHAEGGKTFRAIADACLDRDIEVITFFAFSTENWKRPKLEIAALMKLLNRYLNDWFSEERAKNTRVHFLGDTTPFSEELRDRKKHPDRQAVMERMLADDSLWVTNGGINDLPLV